MSGAALTIPGQMSFDEVLGTPTEHASSTMSPVPSVTSVVAQVTSVVPAPTPSLQVEVIRSSKRRKTAEAQVVGAVLEVRIPSRCSADEEQDLIEHFRAKFERSQTTKAIDLEQRAAELADEYGLPRPATIRWVSNQHRRWGSCTPVDRSVRLSDRLVGFPAWVVDYVIVHELAHLVIDVHSQAFWELVASYPLTERARGFLIAKSDG